MRNTKKLMSLLLCLVMLFSLSIAATAASGEPSGEAAGDALTNYEVLTETKTYPDGLTIPEGTGYTAEEGYFVVMTVDGQYTPQKPGTYEGEVVLAVVKMSESNDGSSDYSTKSILLQTGDELIAAEAALNGKVTDKGISGADITVDDPNMSIVTVTGGEYSIEDSNFHILQTGNHESGGNDFTGDGCAISATGDSVLYVDNVKVVGDGVTRTSLYGGLSTREEYPTIYVSNSHFIATGDEEGEDCAVWVLGLHGVVRTCQFCDYYDVYYYNTIIDSFGWACLSVDGTEAPTSEDLAELQAAYVEGEGYANADGEIMDVKEFAIAATGLTDEYLAELDAVASAEDMEKLPQTNDTSLYYYAGKNTLVDSELKITDMDKGNTGYSSYSIGANINVYSGCDIVADYGNVEANEYASIAYVNGTTVDARKSIMMNHSNAGGVTFCADSELNADEIAFIYKGTGDGYTQENLDENAASGMMIMGATGSNLYVRNCLINSPVILLAFDSDDPGSLGGSSITFDDSIAPKDENHDVTQAKKWGPASTMWASGTEYYYNEVVEAYFEDCTGETALNGDFFNGHQFTSKNLVLTFDNSEINGIISSGWVEHEVDGVDRYIEYGGENITGEDGLVYGYREHLGRVSCTASETVNNGVIVSLTNGSVWNVTETSYVSVLNVDDSSKVNGTVTVLDNGIIKVEPLAGAKGGDITVTFAHSGETVALAAGEDLVFTISCAAPADMGPIADGEAGSGVTTTSGSITYSNVTLGGPNQYPTAETVTISGITEDCTVTITPNPLEADGEFPTVTMGAASAASGGSGEPSGEASAEPAKAAMTDEEAFNAYIQYLVDFMTAYDGVGDGSFDDSARMMAIGELDTVAYGDDVNAFPIEMFVNAFGAQHYDVWYAENVG